MQFHPFFTFWTFWTRPWVLKLRGMKGLQEGLGCGSNILLTNRIMINKVFLCFCVWLWCLILCLMTLLTKNSQPPTKKIFFECRLEDLLHLLSLWTALYHFRRPSYVHAKSRAIRLFWCKIPQKLLDAKVLIYPVLEFSFPKMEYNIMSQQNTMISRQTRRQYVKRSLHCSVI